VVEAQEKYLPQFGIELVGTYHEADVICTHGTTYMDQPADKPVVNINHGLYWSIHDWPAWAHDANSLVVEAMSRAQFHTAPSHWVANALRRGMMVYPEIVHHGIDANEWTPADDHQDFVLWNKARADAVSDPQDMVELAKLLPDVRFLSTIGGMGKPSNVEEIGVMTVDDMKEFVQHAGVYLATARETFGIGTLEAMSCAVPVVGWDWGGQSEIVKHGETGFLAKPGDYEALAEGVQWALRERTTWLVILANALIVWRLRSLRIGSASSSTMRAKTTPKPWYDVKLERGFASSNRIPSS
jgi:glycosyltransferase involved in cell wall biosynthesis